MYSRTLYWCGVWKDIYLFFWYSVFRKFRFRIDTRCNHMLTMFIEKIIIFPTNLTKYFEIFHPDNFEISFICYVSMKRSDSRNTQNLPEYYCLPTKYKLRMKMNNIWFESTNPFHKSRSEGKSNLKIWIKKCRKSFYTQYLNAWVTKFRKSWIIRNNDEYFMTTIREFFRITCNTCDNPIDHRMKCIRKIDNFHRRDIKK